MERPYRTYGLEPSTMDGLKRVNNSAPVAQLDRVGGFEPLGREFESLRVRQLKKPRHFGGFFLIVVLEVFQTIFLVRQIVGNNLNRASARRAEYKDVLWLISPGAPYYGPSLFYDCTIELVPFYSFLSQAAALLRPCVDKPILFT